MEFFLAKPSQPAVVAAADESAAHVEGRHRRPPLLRGKLGAERIAALHLVQFDHGVLGAVRVQCLLGLDAEGSCGEREHDRGLRDILLKLRLDCHLIVVAGLELGKLGLELSYWAVLDGNLE